MPEDATTEIELKLRLPSPADLDGVFALPALAGRLMEMPRAERLEAWYFDTADGALRQAGLAYRIRREGGNWVATVKADKFSGGGLHARREWNVTVDEPQPDIGCFQATEAGPLLAGAVGDEPLVRLFATVFDRRKANAYADDGSIVEVAADQGEIVAGDCREAICEVELELKEGKPAAVLALGAELARALPAEVEARSKYFRALVLAGLAAAAPAPRFSPPAADGPAAAGLVQMLAGQLAPVFAAYERFRQNSADPEELHRLRVQFRRLRSLLAFAKPVFEPAECKAWQQKLQALSRATNRLRETDVVIDAWQAMTDGARLSLSPPPWLGLMLQNERARLAGETAAALEEARPTATLLAFWAAFAGVDAPPPAVNTPLAAFAAARLADWLGAVREAGKKPAWDDVDHLHRLRIQSKKLRYALEGLPLYDRKTRLLILRLKDLQDCLGQRVDSRTIDLAMNAWMSGHASRVVHRDAGLVTGWAARQGAEAGERYGRVWRRFRRAARRWLKEAKDD